MGQGDRRERSIAYCILTSYTSIKTRNLMNMEAASCQVHLLMDSSAFGADWGEWSQLSHSWGPPVQAFQWTFCNIGEGLVYVMAGHTQRWHCRYLWLGTHYVTVVYQSSVDVSPEFLLTSSRYVASETFSISDELHFSSAGRGGILWSKVGSSQNQWSSIALWTLPTLSNQCHANVIRIHVGM